METNSNQKVSCIVNYAYEASEPDELTLRVGDVVRDVERLAGGWWRGELRGRRGMFPDNFVSVLTDATPGRSSIQGRCRAVFSYQPANPDELPLCVGDVLEVLGEVEEGWWQGRRQGRVGVFPSNFVVLLDAPTVPAETAPALPPKPVKEQCLVLFPYTAVNEDELSLAEGEVVTLVSRDAPDRGWWRGELRGKQGLFPDNFVQLIPNVAQDVDEKKPDRPPSKTNAIYPILNKYSEKTASVKELTTSKISLHKENTISKESTTQSTVTHTNKNESEKLIHSESVTDGTLDGQKKPPVPLKKSPTPTSGVGGLFSGLKNKMMSSSENLLSRDKEKDKEKDKPAAAVAPATVSNSNSSSSGEWDRSDRTDGALITKQTNSYTFDHVERNSILNDPRAGRVKAPRRRPPSQSLRDDLQVTALSNGHSDTPPAPPATPAPTATPAIPAANTLHNEKTSAVVGEEIKPRAREWEKHRAPWMEELKLNQAKKSADPRPRPSTNNNNNNTTDRIPDVGMEEKRSTHSMEMSKSTSAISSRISVLESFEETKVRHSLDSKKDSKDGKDVDPKQTAQSPTAAGRTFTTMLEDLKKPPTPPVVTTRTQHEDKSPIKMEKTSTLDKTELTKSTLDKTELTKSTLDKTEFTKSTLDKTEFTKIAFDRANTVEKMERNEERTSIGDKVNTLERRIQGKHSREEKCDLETLVVQLNNRISNLEKLLEVQNAKFTAIVEELTVKLNSEVDKRQALQAQLDKLAHCVTSV